MERLSCKISYPQDSTSSTRQEPPGEWTKYVVDIFVKNQRQPLVPPCCPNFRSTRFLRYCGLPPSVSFSVHGASTAHEDGGGARAKEMKIQCDVCEAAPATIVCCADEAALCADCDVQVHAANKLASKHQRLLLQSLPSKHPRCDICQEKPAFIFCLEDRALFCRECDEPMHVVGSLSRNHQRLLITGINVALSSTSNKKETMRKNVSKESSNDSSLSTMTTKVPMKQISSTFTSSAWVVDQFLQLSDNEDNDKKASPNGFGELDWFSDIRVFPDDQAVGMEMFTASEVPELPTPHANNATFLRPYKSHPVSKKPRYEISDDEDFFVVPDLG